MDETIANMTAVFLKALAHPMRIKILKMLESGERCVCELMDASSIEQSNLSQHLSILKKQGILVSRKEGSKVIYRILYPSVLEVLKHVEKTLGEQLSDNQTLLRHLR